MKRTGLDSTTADLLHSAVHDLKGPAARIRLGAQLLGRSGTALDEDARTLLKHVEDSAAAVELVAEGLRNYAEICARPLEREQVDLGQLLAGAVSMLRDQIDRVGAQVTHSCLPVVSADRFLMVWLLQELLSNSIRFRAENPLQVHISGETGGAGGWYVAVADNGSGIEPLMARRAFLPFKKLTARGGVGLGLTICRKIVELHGGDIWIEPHDGGAEFRFFVA
jgi:signal transduction histidine kinase